jgi:phosphoglycerate dehydrogenase-like enzyme
MTKKLLITDTFYVFDNHVSRLQAAGYEVIRLDKSAATEAELIEALKGVSVYIIGGIEQVTAAVIDSVTSLEAILFPGVDYEKYIPAAEAARQKGIKLLNAPAANAAAVAEFAVGVAIAMQRDLFGISRTGDKKYLTTKSIENSVIGMVGAGNIGQAIISGVSAFNPAEIVYYNRSPKAIAARQVELESLVATADIIFISLPLSAGLVFDTEIINQLKPGCLIVSISPLNLIDFKALLPRLQRGEIRCAIDWPAPSSEFENLPLDVWFNVQSHSAFDTYQAVQNVSDAVTDIAISLLADK